MDYTEADLEGFVSRLKATSRQICEVMKLLHGDAGQCSVEQHIWEYKMSVWGGADLHNIFVHQQNCLDLIHKLLLRVEEARNAKNE